VPVLNDAVRPQYQPSALSAEGIRHAPNSLELAAGTIVAIASAAVLTLVVVCAYAGFDFTDEGFYLLSIAKPFQYTGATVTFFSFVYHPLYELAHGDIGLLRMSSYGITFILSCLTCGALFFRFFKIANSVRSGLLVSLSALAAIASSSLLITAFELPQSPSYNTLLWQAMLLGVGALLLIDAQWPRLATVGSVLFGISCALAGLAKPPSAIAFMLVGLLCLLIQSQLSLRRLAIMAGAGGILLAIFVWTIDGSAHAFYMQLSNGLALAHLLGGGQLSWSQESLLPFSYVESFTLLAASLIFGAIIFSSALGSGMMRSVGVAGSMILALAAIGLVVGGFPLEVSLKRYDGAFALAVPTGGLILLLTGDCFRFITRSHLAFFILLLLLPHAYAFGTGRPHWLNAEAASFSWILLGVIAVSVLQDKAAYASWRLLLPIGGGAIFATAVFISAGVKFPMRQTEPLWANRDVVEIGEPASRLYLSDDYAKYVNGLRRLAQSGGFEAGTPIIDLTGYSPGAVFAVNGVAVGVPWLLGGYAGSEAFAGAALDLATCADIARAWILQAPASPARISGRVLTDYGIEIGRDYLGLGALQGPAQPFGRPVELELLKPRRVLDDAQLACESKKREHAVADR
jgi:hypothetical protein